MVRRFALLLLPLAALGLGYLAACGGEKDFTYDAGPGPQPAVDAGPCDVYAQTNCASDLKCTILGDGGPICGQKGSGSPYAACADDTQCQAGTACVDLQFSGFLAGNHCYPFCELSKQPTDGGTTCSGAGATCLDLHTIPEGFCDVPADGG